MKQPLALPGFAAVITKNRLSPFPEANKLDVSSLSMSDSSNVERNPPIAENVSFLFRPKYLPYLLNRQSGLNFHCHKR